MSRTDSEHLEFLKLARDKVTDAIAEGKDITTVVMGSKTATFKARDSVLDSLEKQISRYQSKVSRSAGRPARNRVRLGKGQRW